VATISRHVLVCRGDIDLWKLGREHPREEDVVALEDLEVAVLDGEPREQHVTEYGWIAVGRQTDHFALVTAWLHAETRGHRFIERPQ
jgi:hypothetical protein